MSLPIQVEGIFKALLAAAPELATVTFLRSSDTDERSSPVCVITASIESELTRNSNVFLMNVECALREDKLRTPSSTNFSRLLQEILAVPLNTSPEDVTNEDVKIFNIAPSSVTPSVDSPLYIGAIAFSVWAAQLTPP